jgi:hypothetical protein
MDLPAYITLIGDKAAAELFGITERAATSYRLGSRSPRPAVARRIVAATGGKVSWADVYAKPSKQEAA